MIYAGKLEHVVKVIRDREARLEGETVDAWARRTWRMALAQVEKDTPELSKVVEGRERTAWLLRHVGKPEKEKESKQ